MERYIVVDQDGEVSVYNRERDIPQDALGDAIADNCIVLCTKIIRIDEIQVRKAIVVEDEEAEGTFIIDDWELVA